MFDLARIAATNLVARIDYHDSLGSTSDRALALAAEGTAELPLLVLAERQTAGRGRGVNRWLTSDGALAFSLVLHAPGDLLPPERWPRVALVAGLAVCEALEELVPKADLRLKWPNDVFVAGRKLCGILSESVPGWRDRLVVGIGVNVNNRVQGSGFRGQRTEERSQGTEGEREEEVLRTEYSVPNISPPATDRIPTTHHSPTPDELQITASSLLEHDNVPRDLTAVLIAVLDHFERRWQDLLCGEQSRLTAAYRSRCFLTGKVVTIEQPQGQRLMGACQGIDDAGQLRLQTERGKTAVVSGTVIRWDA